MDEYIFKSSGQYLGFIKNLNVYTWEGKYLGWIENNFVWDPNGQFKGKIMKLNEHNYILKNIYELPPLPKVPKLNPLPIIKIPTPLPNIDPINLEIGLIDSF
jgi:hypothetical protein